MPNLKGKKVLFLIASGNFRDEEFEQPYTLLKQLGAETRVASSVKTPCRGMLGKTVTPDLLLTDCKASDYQCVIFIGGGGAAEYFNNAAAHGLAKDTLKSGGILAAICIAPAILANAGVLKGCKATCFPSVANTLSRNGATVVKKDVVQDGKVITATGPEAAREFAQAIAKALEQ